MSKKRGKAGSYIQVEKGDPQMAFRGNTGCPAIFSGVPTLSLAFMNASVRRSVA